MRARWDQFETTSRSHQPAKIELTAGDLNQLIATNRRAAGKAFVSIENNIAHAHVSIPVEGRGFSGRYFNGDFTMRPSSDRNPRNLQVSEISLNGVEVPERILNWLLGAHSLRSYIDEYCDEYDVKTFTIEENKVVIETNSGS